MGRTGRALAGALALLALLSFGNGARGLFETSEGRYGSIAAEMSRTGDYLVPRLDGVEHFEKPPLAMWAMALSVDLFGESEAALRLPGALAALCALAAAHRLAGGRRATWAVLLTLASPLFFGMAHAVTTDVYLAACSALALLGAARSVDTELDPRARARALTLAAAASAAGFLVKGPVIWILVLGPMLLEAAWSRDLAQVRRILAPARVLLFLAIATPWYLIASARTPGLLGWFLGHRTVSVLSSSEGFHAGSPLYYAPVMLAGLLPATWILATAGRAGWRALLVSRQNRLLLCALVLPLVVFSLSASKLATYVLPLAVPAGVLAADALERGLGRWGALASSALLALAASAGLCVGIARGWLSGLPGNAGALFGAAAVVAAAGAVVAGVLALRERIRPSSAALCASLVAALVLAVPAVGIAEGSLVRTGSGREVARALSELASDGRPILAYRCFVRSLPFYTGRRILLADFLEPDVTYRRNLEGVEVRGTEELHAVLQRGPVAILCRTKQADDLQRATGPLDLIEVVGAYSIFSSSPEQETAGAF